MQEAIVQQWDDVSSSSFQLCPPRSEPKPLAPILDRNAVAAILSAEFACRWPENLKHMAAIHGYALSKPGKMLRPLLLIFSALAAGGEFSRVLPAAVGIECTHMGSLMHDDIIDRDDVRRGRPAVHVKFGSERAMIAGNALYFTWFETLSECLRRGVSPERVCRAVEIQARAGILVCCGADREVTMAGHFTSSLADYMEMARLKTAVLLSTACQIGAVLAGAPEEQIRALGDFGEHLGMTFQLRDDLLPYDDKTSAMMGKPVCSDLRNRRPTFPVLMAYAEADPADRAAIEQVFTTEPNEEVMYTRMRELLLRTGALAAAHRQADQYAQRARDALAALPAGPYVDVLAQLT